MKVSLSVLKSAEELILNKIYNVNFPIKKLFQMRKYVNALKEELANLDNARIELVKKHGEEDETGNFKIDPQSQPEAFQAFIEDYKDLLQQETEINIDYKPIVENEIACLGDNFTLQELEFLIQLGIVEAQESN
jgi:hypothetical protein